MQSYKPVEFNDSKNRYAQISFNVFYFYVQIFIPGEGAIEFIEISWLSDVSKTVIP
jgi:hypothetical protein